MCVPSWQTSDSSREPGPSLDVVAIGETMLALRPTGAGLLENARTFDCLLGGAEVNCLVALSRLGVKAGWISKLPDSPLGRWIAVQTRGQGIECSSVVWTPAGRVGLMFQELGSRPRPHRVWYDRKGSAFSTLSVDDVDWNYVTQARHLHLTGITPALSDSCRQVTGRAIQLAREAGLSVSLDVNFRSALWSEREAQQVLGQIVQGIDLLIISQEEAGNVFGCQGGETDVLRGLSSRFGCPAVVLTLGDRGAAALVKGEVFREEALPARVVNRFGMGDAFSAGVLYGFLEADVETGLQYGTALAALKGTIHDSNLPLINTDDLQELLEDGEAGATDTNQVRR